MIRLIKHSMFLMIFLFFSCNGAYMFDRLPQDETPTPTPPAEPRSGDGGSGTFSGEFPSIPLDLRVTSFGSSFVNLAWDDSDLESGYRLYRNDIQINSNIPADTVAYNDTGLPQNTQYCYKIKAFNNSGESDFSEEVCQTTTRCSNGAGPTITLNTANPSKQYPSVLKGEPFNKQTSVSLRYSLADGDSCDSNFNVTVEVFRDGETTDPVYSWSGSETPGNKTKTYNTPSYLNNPYIGFYDLKISASDGTFSDQKTFDNYFQISALPADSAAPYISGKSPDGLVCPGQNYTVRFDLRDENVTPVGPLPADWIHGYIYEEGATPIQRRSSYTNSISYATSYNTQPAPEGIILSYYADGYDYMLNRLSNPSSNKVNIMVIRDDTPPVLNLVTLPQTTELQSQESYSIAVQTTDCSSTVYKDYAFVWSTGRNTFRSHTTSGSVAFTPDGLNPPIGTIGWFEVKATDVAGNISTVTSSNYTIVQSHKPTLEITTTPASPFTTDQDISINLTVIDNDLPGVMINYIQYVQPGSIPTNIVTNVFYLGHEHTAWTTPVFPGEYYILAEIQDAEGNKDVKYIAIQVDSSVDTRSVVYLDYNLNGSLVFDRVVQFDINGDSAKEWTKWLNRYDGYLVRDGNSNGFIEDINEFAFLNEMISQAGDVLNSSDSLFDSVKIWIDADSDGITDTGELKTLEDANIISVTLNPCCSFTRW